MFINKMNFGKSQAHTITWCDRNIKKNSYKGTNGMKSLDYVT